MNKEELLQKLKFLLDGDGIGLSMYFILKSEDKFIVKQADIDKKVEPKLKEQFLSYIEEEILENSDLKLTNLTTADSRKNTIYSYDFDEVPEGLKVMNELIKDEERDTFNFRNDDFSSIFGFVFLLGTEAEKVAIYKKHW